MKLHGIFPPLTTPFDHNGDIWKVKVEHNVSRLNLTGVAGYVVIGSTGDGIRISNLKWQISDGRSQTSKLKSQIADLKFHAVPATSGPQKTSPTYISAQRSILVPEPDRGGPLLI